MSLAPAQMQKDDPHTDFILRRILVSVLIFVFCPPILCVFWLASLVKLAFIQAWVGAIRGQSLELLAPMDAMMAMLPPEKFTDPLCPMTINHVGSVRGAVNVLRFRQMVQEKLIGALKSNGAKKFPNITKRVVQKYGYLAWEQDEDFSVANHVRVHSRSYSDTASLVQLLQDMQSVPLPKQRPLWEFVLVPKAVNDLSTGEEEYTMIFRIHHVMADGVYITLMMSEMTDQGNAKLMSDINKALERKLPVVLQNNPFLRHLAMPKLTKLTPQSAISIAMNLLEILVMIPWYASESFFFKEENNGLSLPAPALSGRKLMALSDKLDLKHFKNIAKGNGCTVNDVLLQCITKAFQKCNAKVPVATDCNVRVVLPVFLFAPSPSRSNGTSIYTVTLPLQDKSSLESLNTISDICSKAKNSLSPLCNQLTITMIINCVPLTVSKYLMRRLNFSMMASNMVGPITCPVYMGENLVDAFFIPPSSGRCAVYFGLLSCKNKVRISVVVDRMVAPSDDIAKQLIMYTEEELRNLHTATISVQQETDNPTLECNSTEHSHLKTEHVV